MNIFFAILVLIVICGSLCMLFLEVYIGNCTMQWTNTHGTPCKNRAAWGYERGWLNIKSKRLPPTSPFLQIPGRFNDFHINGCLLISLYTIIITIS